MFRSGKFAIVWKYWEPQQSEAFRPCLAFHWFSFTYYFYMILIPASNKALCSVVAPRQRPSLSIYYAQNLCGWASQIFCVAQVQEPQKRFSLVHWRRDCILVGTVLHNGVPHYVFNPHETLEGIVESFCSSRHVSTWKRMHAITILSLLRAQVDRWTPLPQHTPFRLQIPFS